MGLWGDIGDFFKDETEGALKRTGKIAASAVHLADAPLGAVSDLAKGTLGMVEHPGDASLTDIFGGIKGALLHRGGQFLADLVGPQGLGGQVIGAIPEPVRQAGDLFLEADKALYDSAISHPLAAMQTEGSLLSQGRSPIENLLMAPVDAVRMVGAGAYSLANATSWDRAASKWVEQQTGLKLAPASIKQAAQLAQTRSFGQSVIVAYAGADPSDPKAVQGALKTGPAQVSSGIIDAILILAADPLNVAGASLKDAAEARKVIGGAQEIAAVEAATKEAKGIAAAHAEARSLALSTAEREVAAGLPAGEEFAPTLAEKARAKAEGLLAARKVGPQPGLTGAEKADLYLNSKQGAKFMGRIGQLAEMHGGNTDALAGAIRDQLLSGQKEVWGDTLSWALAKAKSADDRELVVRSFIGDNSVVGKLQARDADLAQRISEIQRRASLIDEQASSAKADLRDFLINNADEWGLSTNEQLVKALNAGRTEKMAQLAEGVLKGQVDDLQLDQRWIDKVVNAGSFGTMATAPTFGVRDAARYAITHSEFYQDDRLSRPLHVLFDKANAYVLALDGVNTDIGFKRYMDNFRDLFTAEEKETWRGKFIDADAPILKDDVVSAFEDEATKRAALRYAGDSDLGKKILAEADESRKGARRIFAKASRRYASNGIDMRRFAGDDANVFYIIPVLGTQAENVRPLVNTSAFFQSFEDYERHQFRVPAWKSYFESPRAQLAAEQAAEAANYLGDRAQTIGRWSSQALDSFYGVWKPMVLLRPAWPVRMVLMEEQLAKLAKMHSLGDVLEGLAQGGGSLRTRYAELTGLLKNVVDPETGETIGQQMSRASAVRRGVAEGMALGGVLGGAPGAVLGGAAGAAYRYALSGVVNDAEFGPQWMRSLLQFREAGMPDFTHWGARITGAFGEGAVNEREIDDATRRMASAHKGWSEELAHHERKWLVDLRRTGEFRSIAPEEAGYARAAEHALNHQIGQDAIAQKFLEGKTREQVVAWATKTPEGREAMRSVPVWEKVIPLHGESWQEDRIAAIQQMVELYTMGDEGIKQAALAGNFKVQMMHKLVEDRTSQGIIDVSKLPVVHGEALAQVLGRSEIQAGVRSFVDKAFKALGVMPTDELSRNPYFANVYEGEVRRQLNLRMAETARSASAGEKFAANMAEGFKIPADELRQVEANARKFALAETQRLFYDLGERSEFSQMMRHILPFFPAQQEIVTRWAGIAAENPLFAGRAMLTYRALDHTIMTAKDSNGDPVIRFRLPQFAAGLMKHSLFGSAIDDQGYVSMDKRTLNMLTTGVGFGPTVQLAASQVVKERPDLEQSFKLILPYGPLKGLENLLPTSMQRLAAGSDEHSAAFTSALGSIMLTKMVKMREGKLAPVDFNDSAARNAFVASSISEARHLFALRAVAASLSPATPTFLSPYADYINAWRTMQQEGRKNGLTQDQVLNQFILKFGDEFFPLTQQITKTNDGVSPTIGAERAYQNHKALIQAHPQFGSLIIGSEGSEASQFSQAVYDAQLRRSVSPGSAQTERERIAPAELVQDPDRREGWLAYGRLMDTIDAVVVGRGLRNTLGKEAADIRAVKAAALAQIASQHPSWWQDYNTHDDTQAARDRSSMRAIAADPKVGARPDISPLRDYFRARDAVVAVLAKRKAEGGAGTLTANANADLADVWEAITTKLVSTNVQFGPVYHRYLERDVLSATDEVGHG